MSIKGASQETIDREAYELLEGIEQEEPVPEVTHYKHPTDPAQAWCGEKLRDATYFGRDGSGSAQDITCVGCLHLFIAKGGDWWWNVHRAWYGTTCNYGSHSGCQ